jgi:ParB family chromosome partitioning protein
MSRKDSKGLFANVLGDTPAAPDASRLEAKMASPHLRKVAAGMREIQERGQLADKLLKEGEHVVELDPNLILDSAISDRFEDMAQSTSVAEIAESIRVRGQIVPGLVRPHPERPGSFQIVYGRRRLSAARTLGVKFRATIRELSDEQAVIFQGEENTNRNDLSFIEKCAFALAQENAGFSRDVISASLSTGKSHISEMLRVASTVPGDILVKIGPAKDIGRRRWVEFAERWAANHDALRRAQATLVPSLNALPSEQRFAKVLAALDHKAGSSRSAQDTTSVVSKGMTLAVVSHAKSGSTLRFEKAVPAGFVDFMASKIEALHDEYVAGLGVQTKTGD